MYHMGLLYLAGLLMEWVDLLMVKDRWVPHPEVDF